MARPKRLLRWPSLLRRCDGPDWHPAEAGDRALGEQRVENSHLAFRGQEWAMLRFRQMKALQKFASVHANIHNHFSLEPHLIDRQTYKERAQPHWLRGSSSRAEPLPFNPTCIQWTAVRCLTAPFLDIPASDATQSSARLFTRPRCEIRAFQPFVESR